MELDSEREEWSEGEGKDARRNGRGRWGEADTVTIHRVAREDLSQEVGLGLRQ